jgi:hypothetical protein
MGDMQWVRFAIGWTIVLASINTLILIYPRL